MLLSINKECFDGDEYEKQGLKLSPSPEFQVYKYLNTRPGRYMVTLDLYFPKSNYLEFAIKDTFPKGITIIEDLKWEFCNILE